MLKSREVSGSKPDEVIGFFLNFHNRCSRPIGRGFTKPVTEIKARKYF
jgi:hypothetical protein